MKAAFIRRDVLAMIALTSGALLLRLYQLGAKPLWIDETYSLDRARAPFSGLWTDLIADHLPTYFAAVWAAYHLLGDAEWALRLPSVLLSSSVPIAILLLGREFGRPLGGALAATLYAISPFVIFWSQEAKPEAAALCVATWSTYLLLVAWRRGGRVRWLVYGIASLLGLYTFYYYTFVFAAHSIGVAFACIRDRRLRDLAAWSALQLVLVALFLPWPLVHLLGHIDEAGFPFLGPAPWNIFMLGFITGPLGGFTGDQLDLISSRTATAAGILLTGLVLLGVGYVGKRSGYSFQWAILAAWLVTPLIGGFCVQLVIPAHEVYYLLLVVPAALLFASFALEAVIGFGRRPRTAYLASATLGLAVVLPWVGMDVMLYQDAANQHSGWRDAAAYFLSHRDSGEVLVADPAWQASTLAYYVPDPTLVAAPERPPTPALSCLTDSRRDGVPGVWVATTSLAHDAEIVGPNLRSIAEQTDTTAVRGSVRIVHYQFLPSATATLGASGWGDFPVEAGSGTVTLDRPGALRFASLCQSAGRDQNVWATIRPEHWPSAGNEDADILARWTSPDSAYLVRVRMDATGTSWLQIGRWVRAVAQPIGKDTLIARGSATEAPRPMALHAEIVGSNPTVVNVKVWPADQPEPKNWLASVGDATPGLQGEGNIAVQAYLSPRADNAPMRIAFDDIRVHVQ